MRSTFVVISIAVVATAAAAVGLRGYLSAQPSRVTSSGDGSISVNTGSADGKETFALEIYKPWDDAPRRIILFTAASVTDAGLSSLSVTRLHDEGAGSAPLKQSGEAYICTVQLNVPTWRDVHAKSDMTLTVERQH